MVGKFKQTEVLLNNQVDVTVIHPTLRREIKTAEEDTHINVVGGHQFTCERTELCRGITFLLPTYVPWESFTVHLPVCDIVFNRRGKMYVGDWEELRSAFITTVYTKAEKLWVKKAYNLLHTSGYPSMSEAAHLVE